MGQVVVQAKVHLVGIGSGQAVTRARTVAESLLHAKHRLQPAEETVGTFPLREPIGALYPISLRVGSVGIFGTHF